MAAMAEKYRAGGDLYMTPEEIAANAEPAE